MQNKAIRLYHASSWPLLIICCSCHEAFQCKCIQRIATFKIYQVTWKGLIKYILFYFTPKASCLGVGCCTSKTESHSVRQAATNAGQILVNLLQAWDQEMGRSTCPGLSFGGGSFSFKRRANSLQVILVITMCNYYVSAVDWWHCIRPQTAFSHFLSSSLV